MTRYEEMSRGALIREAQALAVEEAAAQAKIEKLREALDEIFTRISYINIHGVGEQPEPTGIPQPMRASPDEFRRIWQEIGNLAGAALDETK